MECGHSSETPATGVFHPKVVSALGANGEFEDLPGLVSNGGFPASYLGTEILKLSDNPTYAILDIGCTRCMGSLQAVKSFLWHAWFSGITYEWIPCNTVMSFANSHTERLKWAVRVKWPTTPALYTTIDVHETSTVPILLSLPQMMNLRFGLTLSDAGCDLTCKLLF